LPILQDALDHFQVKSILVFDRFVFKSETIDATVAFSSKGIVSEDESNIAIIEEQHHAIPGRHGEEVVRRES
jgi:hypothetical protein